MTVLSWKLLLLRTTASMKSMFYVFRLIPAMIDLDLKQCEKDSVALSCSHVEQTLVHTQSIIEIIFSELRYVEKVYYRLLWFMGFSTQNCWYSPLNENCRKEPMMHNRAIFTFISTLYSIVSKLVFYWK